MEGTQRVRRNGYHLMSLASIGQFACVGMLIWNLTWRGWSDPAAPIPDDPATIWMIALLAFAVWLAQFWTLIQLRRIGKLLYSGIPISHDMAAAWRRLGHGLVATALLMVFPVPLPEASGQLDFALRLDIASLYFVTIGGLCIYTVAYLLHDAAQLRDDVESIV